MRMSSDDTTGATSLPQTVNDGAAQPVAPIGTTTGQSLGQPTDQTAAAPAGAGQATAPPAQAQAQTEPQAAGDQPHSSFWDKFAAIASTVGVNVLLFTPLAPIAPIVAAGIAEAQKIPGATGPEKLQHVAVLIQEAVLAANTQAGRQVLDPQLVNDTYTDAVNTAVAAIKLVHSTTPKASQDVARAAIDAMKAKVLPGTTEALEGRQASQPAAAGTGTNAAPPPITERGSLAGRTAAGFSSQPSQR